MTPTLRRPRALAVLLAAMLAAATTALVAQQPDIPAAVRTARLEDIVPVDPRITVGTLPNGLRYYVRQNGLPQARAEIRLVVNAGSVLEDDDQRGLAHFVEHMAFNGSLHFPKSDIGAFMQSVGMRFGAHVNAHTSFDETVYELQIPTHDPAIIDRALLILEDWAQFVSFDAEEIEKERGVVLEEWRLGLGAGERIRNVQLPLLLNGSRYADRSPIGRPEVISGVSHARIRQFYSDWYRPDLMAVIAVGDFDPAAMEAQIRRRFGAIPARPAPRTRPVYTVPPRAGTTVSIVTDPEATSTTVNVTTTMTAREQATIGSYRQHLVEGLFESMLSSRLYEVSQTPNAPFLRAGTNRGLFLRTAETTSLDAIVAAGGVERGLAALFTELERVVRFGFTQGELEREKLNLQRGLQRAVVERDKSPSAPLADEFVRAYTTGEPIPGIVYEFGLVQRFLPEITLAEVNGLAKDWMPDRNRLVAVSAPQRDAFSLPAEAKLGAVIDATRTAPVTAYVDTASQQPLLPRLPAPGRVASTLTHEAFGITEWRLSNGVRVVLKPTTFKQDEIVFRAVSPGGTSLASDAQFIPAATAILAVGQGGLGAFRLVDLEKRLAGTTAVVRANIGETDEGLAGGSAGKDLETMFQLIHLTFTAPRADPVAFGVLKEQLRVGLANRAARPDTLFDEALEEALSQGHLRSKPFTVENLEQMDLDASMAFYKDRFGDAGDFLFVFVGSFDLAAMQPLVERYLGSLPSGQRVESARDVGLRPPTGIVERTVTAGVDPRSQVAIVFTGPFVNDEANRVVTRAMAETLAGNLQRRLREDLGGTYGVSVVPSFSKVPRQEYRITIEFACDPARTEALVKAAFEVIDRFAFTGPSPNQVLDTRVTLERDFETNGEQNGYLVNRLLFKYQYGEDVKDLFDIRPYVDRITVDALRDAAQRYLNVNRYVKVTLRPETRP